MAAQKKRNNFDLKMKTKETKDSDKRMTDRFVNLNFKDFVKAFIYI